MSVNQFLPFATAGGADVLSPSAYSALAVRLSGFTTGVADSTQLNTVWRQASFATSAIAQTMADITGQDINDDGVIANFQTRFRMMLALGDYGVDTGSANSYAVTFAPAFAAISDGLKVRFKAAHANTGASTFNPNSTGAVAILNGIGYVPLVGGEIAVNSEVTLIYNSTLASWILAGSTGTITPLRMQKFTASGTWTCPAGVTTVYVTGSGGGGGGGGMGGTPATGATGGTTEFDSLLTLAGGLGGTGGSASIMGFGGAPGGDKGFYGGNATTLSTGAGPSGYGGGIGGGPATACDTNTVGFNGANAAANSGGGGGGSSGAYTSYLPSGGGGSGELCDRKSISVTPGTTYTITINAGGAGGAGSSKSGGNGASGYLLLEW